MGKPIIQDIAHYRGDSYDANIFIDGYTPTENDEILFCIRKKEDSEDFFVEKEINPNTMRLHLNSSETQNLPTKAVYDIQVKFSDEEGIEYTKTIVKGEFNCDKDVARR